MKFRPNLPRPVAPRRGTTPWQPLQRRVLPPSAPARRVKDPPQGES
jgi:hypothetical protein